MNLAFTPSGRDYRGYGDNPPAVRWPNGARLALSIVVNFEEGGELSLSRGDERNEYVYEIVERIDGVPDACMESHFAYGTRAGWPRIRALLKRYGVKGTINACGRAVATSPWLAAEAAADGHEVCSPSPATATPSMVRSGTRRERVLAFLVKGDCNEGFDGPYLP